LQNPHKISQELNIHAEIGEYFCTSTFTKNQTLYDMCVFKVHSFQGEIILNEHSAMAWVTPAELSNYTYPDPDLPIIELLQK
jgi:hypothetical protein